MQRVLSGNLYFYSGPQISDQAIPGSNPVPGGTTVPITGHKTGLETFTYPLGNVRYRVDRRKTLINAAVNVVNNVATMARSDSRLIMVYSIGLGNVSATNETLLKRVANDGESPIHTQTTPTGLNVYAPDSSALAQAFYQIASEILRLAR